VANLYQDTAEPIAPAPPLEGEARCDVAIVGAGFTGLSCALHLALRATHVVVLEAHAAGWGASGRNGGQVNPGLKHDPDTVERDFGADLGARMVAFSGRAPDVVFDLIGRHRIDCESRRCGTLRAAIHAHQAEAVRRTAEQQLRRAAPVEWLERDAVARATGTDRYRGAMLDRRGGELNPLKFARGLARAATRAGAALHENSRVEAIERSAQGWRLRTSRGAVTASKVLLATNGYTDGIWPNLRRTLVPIFGAIAATEPLPESVARAVMPSRSVLYESGAVTVYYRVDGTGRLLIGGRGPMREISQPKDIAHLLAYAHRLWPDLGGARWSYGWGGQLAMTADQYPHIHEPAPGVMTCLGYNGRGIALATALGAPLAARILDPAADIDMPISTMKTLAFHSLWPLAVRAAVARGRLLDWLGR
jgi:glycine/D-amino acid oxidase-like deaminating enzyme